MIRSIVNKITENRFLFSELLKRDLKKKYKSTILGFAWSMLSPILTLAVMSLVFTHIFGRTTEHYTVYLFAGNIMFSFFSESTGRGMGALVGNADIYTRIKMPKFLFVLSANLCSVINFFLTFLVFSAFCVFDGIAFKASMLLIPIPILSLIVFSLGMCLILSVLFVFFRDMQYLWSIFTMLLMYLSAIFYTVDTLPEAIRGMLYLNPIYCFISYLRTIIIAGDIPGAFLNTVCPLYAFSALFAGILLYRRYHDRLIYYI